MPADSPRSFSPRSSPAASSSPLPGAAERPAAEPGPWGLPWDFWRRTAALLSPPPRRGRRADTDLCAVVAAVLYQERTGCPWRRLPGGFPPWQTVYGYRRRWLTDGTLRKIRAAAADGPPPADGR